ncbi:hypothetical protein GCM10027429_03710 [Marivirga atlantica]|jgi:hypothetical protein|uniref:Uncharacterized protein n=1 Tax=Marivirga atlantica TaxID=1548457 RepID=A0A937DFR6_9BACT|nr:hypothetical protein [Marivirga atlantica]MBL0763983.1 hypothetical protein [Marivirga atlantica]
MPIKIYVKNSAKELDWLCNDIWDLATQLDVLERWLTNKGQRLSHDEYVADIGFNSRSLSSGGGGVLSTNSMSIMSKIGMCIYFSEY